MMGEGQINICYGLLIILVGTALYTDLKYSKIKNVTTYPFIVLGMLLNLLDRGRSGVLESLYGLLLPIALLAVFYLLGAMGAGDLKLFGAIGALMGREFVLKTMAVSLISGGLMALFLMIVRKNGRERFRYLINYIILTLIRGKISPYSHMKSNRDGKFPFAIAVFIGVLMMIFLKPL